MQPRNITEPEVCNVFLLIAQRCAREYGKPLPERLLAIGDQGKGWGVRLNASDVVTDGVRPFEAVVHWNGMPAGSLGYGEGFLAAGGEANEKFLGEWLVSDSPDSAREKTK